MDLERQPSQSPDAALVNPRSGSLSPPMVPMEALNAMRVEPGRASLSLNAAPVGLLSGAPSPPMEPVHDSISRNVPLNEASHTFNAFPEEGRGSKSLNMMSMDATYNRQLPPVDAHTFSLNNRVPVEVSRTSKSLNVMPVELERATQLLLVPAQASDDDVRTIKEVLSVHHVPVVASLHWEKLHTILHTLCDRIAIQALRLEKAEEQGKSFLGFKEELDQLWYAAGIESRTGNASASVLISSSTGVFCTWDLCHVYSWILRRKFTQYNVAPCITTVVTPVPILSSVSLCHVIIYFHEQLLWIRLSLFAEKSLSFAQGSFVSDVFRI